MGKPIKVLYLINELNSGGAQKILADIAGALAASEAYETGVLFFRDSKDSPIYRTLSSHPRIKLYDLSGSPLWHPSLWKKTREIIRQYDIVHANLFPAGYVAAIAGIGSGIPLLYTEHSTHNRRREKKWLRPLERAIYSRFARIAGISSATSENLKNWLNKKKISHKTVTIHNGVETARFKKQAGNGNPEETFGRKGIPIIMISRFTESKDHGTVIKAIPYIRNKEAYVVFVGDGPLRQEMEELTRETGVADKVVFTGSSTDIPALVGAAKIGVQSSNWEGFGLTAIELMAGGVPVIASDVPGLSSIVEGAGLLFEKGDHKGLADAINLLMEEDELYHEVKEKGFERASEYDLDKTITSYRKLYSDLI